MRRIVTVSYTGIDAPGGVPKFNRDLHDAFQDRERAHFCWDDFPFNQSPDLMFLPEWEKARLLNQFLLKDRRILRDDVIVADGFWASGLEFCPNAISHSHGIWGHITKEDRDAGKRPENEYLHNAQVEFRRRWVKFGKHITAVSKFIARELDRQWGIQVDRVINNGVDINEFCPQDLKCPSSRPVIVHGVNDVMNHNKGWDHIELLSKNIDADVMSLDELTLRWKFYGQTKAKTLAGSALVVHPSGFEGNSMFVAETLACGVPIVAYDVGALADPDAERCGWILDRNKRSPDHTLEIVQFVMEQLKYHREVASKAARAFAVENLSKDRFVREWRSYVEEIEG